MNLLNSLLCGSNAHESSENFETSSLLNQETRELLADRIHDVGQKETAYLSVSENSVILIHHTVYQTS